MIRRKFLAGALAGILVLALTACGTPITPSPLTQEGGTEGPSATVPAPDTSAGKPLSTEPSPATAVPPTSAEPLPQVDWEGLLSGNGQTDVIYGKLDASQKKALVDAGKADGVEISFGADGSTTIVDTDGTVVIQGADGSWSYREPDGGEGQLGGSWPDNEYTKLLPKPEFSLVGAAVEENVFSVIFSEVTMEQIKAYVEKVKSAGFTKDAETEDQEYAGMTVYAYTASNAAGDVVNIFSTAGVSGLTLEKQ